MHTIFTLINCCAALSSLPNAYANASIKVRLSADPKTIDWSLAESAMETYVIMNIMEGLFEFDSKLRPTPRLAKSWTVTPDGLTYTVTLRSDVKWSDGQPLTARDFVYSWKRLLDPATASTYAYFLFSIVGAEAFNSKLSTDFSTVGIKAVSDTTIQIRLKTPNAYFLQLLTFWVTFPMRKDLVDRFGKQWTKPGNIAVLGPFIPTEYKPETRITLTRNELYFSKRPALDTVVMKTVTDDSTALQLYNSGQLDFVRPIAPLEIPNLQKNQAFRTTDYLRSCYLNLNTRHPFGADLHLRQATAMAIDRNIIPELLHGTVQKADAYIPQTVLSGKINMTFAFNPKGSAQLAASAPSIARRSPIELIALSNDSNRVLAEFIQDQLHKNAGIDVQLRLLEDKTYRARLFAGNGAIFLRCWGADYPDPDSYLQIFSSRSGNNTTGWKSSVFDDLINRAASEQKDSKRTELYGQATELLLKKDAIIVPLYFDQLVYLLRPGISGFRLNPLNYVYFRDAVKEN